MITRPSPLDALDGTAANTKFDGNSQDALIAERQRLANRDLPHAVGVWIGIAFIAARPARGAPRRAFDAKPLHMIDQPWVMKARDEVFAARGRWLANQVVAVLSIVLGWGVPRGLVKLNAAAGVPKIRRPKNRGVANKAWTPTEVDAILKATSGGLRMAIALAYYGGLRKADVVKVPRAARAHGSIDMEAINKNGKELSIFEARRLTAILDEKDSVPNGRVAGATLVLNRLGASYTSDGLDSVFDKAKRELVKTGTIRSRLTFHGLRKSLGKRAADLGFSENDIAGALGQTNPASSRPYTLEAARKKGALRVFKA